MIRTAIFAAAAILAGASSAQYLNQTTPFNLVLLSPNTTINGSAVGGCHEGAAIQGFCLGRSSPFTFNYSSSFSMDPTIGTVGHLTFQLQGGNFNISSVSKQPFLGDLSY
jgi:hypothetical protein